MKKRVTAELISIAHRILKLKNHSETVQLQLEAKNLYDQLTILRFYEEHFEMVKNEISEDALEAKLEGKKADVFEQPIAVVEDLSQMKSEISEELIVKSEEPMDEKIIIAKLEIEEEDEVEKLNDSDNSIIVSSEVVGTKAKQISFEDLLVHDYKELDFVKVEDVPAEVEKITETIFDSDNSEVTPVEVVKEETQPESIVDSEILEPKVLEEEVKATIEKTSQESKVSSLNDRLNKTISFGLNDRIGFEKKLFGGSSDDFNRVVSQLNTFDNFEEARSFVNDFVKPDYNNWEGAEEFETRFMEIVEKKFN